MAKAIEPADLFRKSRLRQARLAVLMMSCGITVSAPPASAQQQASPPQAATPDKSAPAASTRRKPKLEEHYELLPPEEGEPDGGPPLGANLDPEGDAPAPRAAAPVRAPRIGPGKGAIPVAPPQAARNDPAPDEAVDATLPVEDLDVRPPQARTTPVNRAAPAQQTVAPEMPRQAKRPPASASEAEEVAVQEKGGGKPDDRAQASAPDAATQFFMSALRSGGEWRDDAAFGKVFVPAVGGEWRPYTQGRWAFSEDFGWTWISDEPFGWATFHYGRWGREDGGRWFWVPDLQWGPAWVIWRQGEDAIGWAPLPPAAKLAKNRVVVEAASVESDTFEETWVFVRPEYFPRSEMRRFIRPTRWNADLADRTVLKLGIESTETTIANRGLSPADIERLSGEPVTPAKMMTSEDANLKEGARITKTSITLYRPGPATIERASRDAARGRTREADAARRPSAKPFSPQRAVLQRTETESAVTESWGAPPPQQPRNAGSGALAAEKTKVRKPDGNAADPGKDAMAAEPPASAPKPSPSRAADGAVAGAGAGTPTPAAQQRWDGSGPSGAPSTTASPR